MDFCDTFLYILCLTAIVEANLFMLGVFLGFGDQHPEPIFSLVEDWVKMRQWIKETLPESPDVGTYWYYGNTRQVIFHCGTTLLHYDEGGRLINTTLMVQDTWWREWAILHKLRPIPAQRIKLARLLGIRPHIQSRKGSQ